MNSAINSSLQNIIRAVSLSKLNDFESSKKLELKEISEVRPVYGFWMALILLSGNEVRITIKSHFTTSEVSALLKNDTTFLDKDEAADLMREYTNMISGSIKFILGNNSISVGTSLPFVVRGFNQLFPLHSKLSQIFLDRWEITDGKNSIKLTSEVEILKAFSIINEEDNLDTGTVEFL